MNRRIVFTVLIPTLLIQAATTMGNTFIPLYSRELGASLSLAAMASALMFAGQALADLPGGYLIHRFGDRTIILSGTLLSIAALALRLIFRNMGVLIFSVILFGIGSSFIWIARMSWLKRFVRGPERGFIMSFVGGSLRLAGILGPLAGGLLAEHLGYAALFTGQGVLFSCAFVVLIFAMSGEEAGEPEHGDGQPSTYRESLRMAAMAWAARRKTILAAAIGISGLTVLRASREILFPLWGSELGLSEFRVGLVVFAGAAVDAALFWISGLIMTRLGRKMAAIICTSGMALAIGLLPFAHSIAVLTALSMLAGLGNATGAGINLTLSGDLAPRKYPGAFLSFWRFSMGMAGFGGPALAAGVITLTGLAGAPLAIMAVGVAGVLTMSLLMEETAPEPAAKKS